MTSPLEVILRERHPVNGLARYYFVLFPTPTMMMPSSMTDELREFLRVKAESGEWDVVEDVRGVNVTVIGITMVTRV
jgi:hypothetical protein